ncbi:hypothetical protein K1W54_17520, partial [Micromonospora sp. CPCC 205371]|nr:hypothetical protein [Micromonospora sp. CPCC 205371]
ATPATPTGPNGPATPPASRPGTRAPAERGARTPLADLGLDKETVRAIARDWGLSTAEKPAAACLSSRIAYGVTITPQRLARVERAEAAARRLLAAHHVHNVRVRDLGGSVRIEVDDHAVVPARGDSSLREAIQSAGFGAVDVTVEPFRSGSMNALLENPDTWRNA